ncbi:hypothetical protein C5167_009383 [Papaver somniferum]|uniref:Uncharacterized protein n=1 Tax=Papaver somniferum TaxID=3469 RepID=A0A4Y7K059_PAPSO|nr:hypothetical protein C5167_009383 [Papaver somniferum]
MGKQVMILIFGTIYRRVKHVACDYLIKHVRFEELVVEESINPGRYTSRWVLTLHLRVVRLNLQALFADVLN